MNQFVGIPSTFFLNEAKQEYCDYRTRLVQELLQNSIDAGATRIDLTLNDEGYSCEDNGHGMTRERMVSALLTMGGTAKESGSTGGFGAAKKLLLFAHESFTIWSNDTSVEGKGLVYNFVNYGKRVGTRVTAKYAPDFDPEGIMVIRANKLLAKCNFRGNCRVYLNGTLFTNYTILPLVRTVPGLGNVYGAKKQNGNSNEILVRHNGLYMFYRYVCDLNRTVAIEVAGASVDMFTQNRDGFRGDASHAFDALVSEMTINKKSFIRAKTRKFVMEGIDSFIAFISQTFTITPEIQAAINHVRMSDTTLSTVGLAVAVAKQVAQSSTASSCDIATAESMATYVKNNYDGGVRKLQTDFHFDLADSSYRKVPAQFVPNVGKAKYTMLAKLWKVCVREVLKANKLNQNFVIGFTFDSSAVATHKCDNGVSCYLINPTSEEIDEGTRQERVIRTLTTAVHEVVHSQGRDYHDEEFMLKFHELLTPTLVNGPTWRQLVKLADAETV